MKKNVLWRCVDDEFCGFKLSQCCSITRYICAGLKLVCECPAEAEEHSETARPELGPEDQTVQ